MGKGPIHNLVWPLRAQFHQQVLVQQLCSFIPLKIIPRRLIQHPIPITSKKRSALSMLQKMF